MNIIIKLSLITTLVLTTNLLAEEKLEDITVTSATKTSQNINDVTSNINVITAQEIEERHYTTVTEALNSLSGVSFTSNGGLGKSSTLQLRGFASKRVLVLINGVKYNEPVGLNGAQFEHLMITDIEQIEVIKGAQSGIWGADATAGVINIITKKAQDGFHIQASQEFGSFKTSKTNVGISFKKESFYLKLHHNITDSNGFTAALPNGDDLKSYEKDPYSNQTSSIKAGLIISPTDKLEISHTIINANSDYDFKSDANGNNKDNIKNKFSSINFNHIDSFNELNLYANNSSFDRKSTSISSFGTFVSKFDSDSREYGINSKIAYASNSFLLVGGDYTTYNYENNINKSYSNKALFLTNNNKLLNFMGGDTIITQSIRHDKYSTFDNKTTGKVGLKYTSNKLKDLTTSINYGTAYNTPTLYNLYDPFSGASTLEPETTKGLDVSLEYKNLSVTYFDNKIENLIDYNTATFHFENFVGTSKIKGYEVAYNTTLFDTIATNLSYTKLKTKDADGFELQRRPDKSIKFGFDYYGIENLHLGVNGEYIGDRIEYAYGTHNINAQTGNYTIANFSANYEVDKHLNFYAKVDNITDKYYQTVDGYATSPRAFYGGMKLTY